jgi:hypothetical protein
VNVPKRELLDLPLFKELYKFHRDNPPDDPIAAVAKLPNTAPKRKTTLYGVLAGLTRNDQQREAITRDFYRWVVEKYGSDYDAIAKAELMFQAAQEAAVAVRENPKLLSAKRMELIPAQWESLGKKPTWGQIVEATLVTVDSDGNVILVAPVNADLRQAMRTLRPVRESVEDLGNGAVRWVPNEPVRVTDETVVHQRLLDAYRNEGHVERWSLSVSDPPQDNPGYRMVVLVPDAAAQPPEELTQRYPMRRIGSVQRSTPPRWADQVGHKLKSPEGEPTTQRYVAWELKLPDVLAYKELDQAWLAARSWAGPLGGDTLLYGHGSLAPARTQILWETTYRGPSGDLVTVRTTAPLDRTSQPVSIDRYHVIEHFPGYFPEPKSFRPEVTETVPGEVNWDHRARVLLPQPTDTLTVSKRGLFSSKLNGKPIRVVTVGLPTDGPPVIHLGEDPAAVMAAGVTPDRIVVVRRTRSGLEVAQVGTNMASVIDRALDALEGVGVTVTDVRLSGPVALPVPGAATTLPAPPPEALRTKNRGLRGEI